MIGSTNDVVASGGVRLRVAEAGDSANPTVVLCHGFPELAYSWRHQIRPLVEQGYHVLAPDQRGYGHSDTPTEVGEYGIRELCGDLLALLDRHDKQDAVFVGHDWGAFIVWDLAKLHPDRVRAVVGVSVPLPRWPAPPTQLMRATYGDRFFYILYFQQVGPAETELGADPRRTISQVLYNASGAGMAAARTAPAEVPPMEGTGFLSHSVEVPALPFIGPEGPWLTEADLDEYTREFAHSGFFGPVSYYRNLDANYEVVGTRGAADISMPSFFIGGELDPVNAMDRTGVTRMQATLPDFRGHVIIPGVGHWTQQEAPQAFNDALSGFLARL